MIMLRSMFARLFSLFMAVILLITVLMSIFSYFTISNLLVSARMEDLKKEAREIAYLASQTQYGNLFPFQSVSSANALLQWKAKQVYDEFKAYIAVVNRQNQILQNIQTVSQNDPDFAAALDIHEISLMLKTARGGQEVQIQTTFPGSDGLAFIVAVPWVENNAVVGTVFIHTSAQVIKASYMPIFRQVIAVMGIAAAISGLLVFLYVKRITKPLTGMASVAALMAQEDFSVRAMSSAVPEIDEVAQAFNIMVERLSMLEESRRTFVANVSHELRSPITSIRGYIEGMLDGTIGQDQYGIYLKIVSDETKRLTKLIADLLSLSRLEQSDYLIHFSAFDINELIRRVLTRFMNDVDHKHIQLDMKIADSPLMVYADIERIEQVIVNLVDNAVKFTFENGIITIEAYEDDQDVYITITNTGEGIPPEDREHIFERFFTANKAHTSGKGTGLGLSICKSILKQHGKNIISLPSGEGAIFRFNLSKKEKTDK